MQPAPVTIRRQEDLAVVTINRPGPAGVVANKRALVAVTESGLEAALAHAAEVQPERFTSDEFRRGERTTRR